jgi:hypothetical protein
MTGIYSNSNEKLKKEVLTHEQERFKKQNRQRMRSKVFICTFQKEHHPFGSQRGREVYSVPGCQQQK